MRAALCLAVVVLCFPSARADDLLGLLDVPVHDGVIRVCRLESIQALVKAAETSGNSLVVRVSSDAGGRKQPCGAEDVFESSLADLATDFSSQWAAGSCSDRAGHFPTTEGGRPLLFSPGCRRPRNQSYR